MAAGHMESIDSQVDLGKRTTDFFDDDEIADHGIHIDSGNVRYSNSPRRGVSIQQVQSPTKSVHPEHSGMAAGHMESIDSQGDLGKRTTDFFDDDSDVDDGLPRESTMDTFATRSRSRSISPAKRKQMPPSGQSFVSKCEPKRVSLKALEPESEGYERMDSNLNQHVPHATSDTESYLGSVEEFLPRKSQEGPKAAARLSSTTRFRTSGLGWSPSGPATVRESIHENPRASSMYSENIDQRLGVHQQAYEMLIQNMMNDPILMSSKRATFKDGRASMLPAALTINDPRSPRDQLPANPSPEHTESQRKKAHFIPPPIDIGSPDHHSLPANLVRTPYPYSPENIQHRRKDYHRSPPPIPDSPTINNSTDLLLTLSIRRTNPNSSSRVTTLTIPASNDYSAIRTNEKGHITEEHTSSKNFDDQELFLQLHKSYKELAGPFLRLFSARSLSRIAVSGTATRAADAGYGWLLSPRSPRLIAFRGLSDTFSEEKILHLYRKPREGKNRFAFVHWARRLAAAPETQQAQTPNSAPETPASPEQHDGTAWYKSETTQSAGGPRSPNSLVTRAEQPEGLEFVVSWSVRRIALALLLVIILAVAASLLWVFLGKQTTPSWPVAGTGGFRSAGDRVGTGVLIGVMVLLVGLTGFGGWLGISWLVM